MKTIFKAGLIALVIYLSIIYIPKLPANAETSKTTEVIATEVLQPDDPPCNKKLSPGFPNFITQWKDLIEHNACKRWLNPDLVAGVTWRESKGGTITGGRVGECNYAGACGPMQVMGRDSINPKTGRVYMCPNGPCFADRPTMKELAENPELNFKWGTKDMLQKINHAGDIKKGLTNYSGGDQLYAQEVLCLSTAKNWNQCVNR